jgi:hypothetical protein
LGRLDQLRGLYLYTVAGDMLPQGESGLLAVDHMTETKD